MTPSPGSGPTSRPGPAGGAKQAKEGLPAGRPGRFRRFWKVSRDSCRDSQKLRRVIPEVLKSAMIALHPASLRITGAEPAATEPFKSDMIMSSGH